MSIIINTGGGGSGSTPDLQQVLIAGSGFSQSNSINTYGFTFAITGAGGPSNLFSISGFYHVDIYASNAIYLSRNGSTPYLQIDQINGRWDLKESSGVNNYFVLDPSSNTYKIGSYSTPNMGSIRISQSDIEYNGDEARFSEVNAQAGTWAFDGADGGFWTANPGPLNNSSDHLIVYINGNVRYIQLREP